MLVLTAVLRERTNASFRRSFGAPTTTTRLFSEHRHRLQKKSSEKDGKSSVERNVPEPRKLLQQNATDFDAK